MAFIVITFGANSGRLDLAAAGAVAAFFLISGIGVIVHKPLTQVPENAIKHTVGVMLMAFGTFWGAEGVGIEWTLNAAAILPIAGFYWLASLVFPRSSSLARLPSLVFIEAITRGEQHRLDRVGQPEAAS